MSISRTGPPLGPGIGTLLVTVSFVVLLWVAVPLSWLSWLFALSWRAEPRVSLRQCTGWFVVNLMAFLQRFIFRFLIPRPSVGYVAWRDMEKLSPDTGRSNFFG